MSEPEVERLVRDVTDTAAATWLLDPQLGERWDAIRDRMGVALGEATKTGFERGVASEKANKAIDMGSHVVTNYDGVSGKWVHEQTAQLASLLLANRRIGAQYGGDVNMPPAMDGANEWVQGFLRGLLQEQGRNMRRAEQPRWYWPDDERLVHVDVTDLMRRFYDPAVSRPSLTMTYDDIHDEKDRPRAE